MADVIPVGIDLGTTNCAVSYIDPQGRTRMVPKEDDSILTPSVVFFEDDGVTVGRAAWIAAATAPERCAEAAKRDMGTAVFRHKILGRDYPPEVIQGCLLRDMRHDLDRELHGTCETVITVPAYFDEARRKATADAGAMSGLKVLDIVNEPTAATLAFGEKLGYLDAEGTPRDDLRLVVYDLGGGTFDVTVVELKQGHVRTLATDGDYELGGMAWDQRLAERIEEEFIEQHPGSSIGQLDHIAIRRAATNAKHELSTAPSAAIEVECDGKTLRMTITREEFESLTLDLLDRTLFTARQAMQAAAVEWSDIDRILLVGGSSRMPMVRHGLEELTGISPAADIHPDEAVARGAAVFARHLLGESGRHVRVPKLSITDVNAHSLGIEGVNLKTQRTENVRVIPKNTQLPCTITKTFVTKVANQPSVKIRLLEGESSVLDQCSPLAMAAIKNLPPGLPKGTKVSVSYTFNANGRLSVSAAVKGHGSDAHIELERTRGVSGENVQHWQKVVCEDGGYRSFEEALDEMLGDYVIEEEASHTMPDEKPHQAPSRSPQANPAVQFGAPQSASDRLSDHFGRSKPRRGQGPSGKSGQ